MKISLEWLRQYVDWQGTTEELDDILTNLGFPVEEIRQVGDDVMLDVEITSNRPDCLGHIGLARELAAATGSAFKIPEVEFQEHGKDVNQWTSVENTAGRLCGRYTARIIDGVKVGPSPGWMARRLETVGIRSINNIVDITNYILMEVGQPMHAFDYAKLDKGRIVVRTALPGEMMDMIDHSKQELNENMLLIADDRKPVALAGIMGGLTSEVSQSTETILLESAHFDPLSIRSTSRALTLSSESSFRFERDVDLDMVEWASRRAAAMLSELAQGKVAPGLIDIWGRDREEFQGEYVQMRIARLNKLVGIDFDNEYVGALLEKLGFAPDFDDPGQTVSCTVPSWRRGDVSREVDLIEEIIRVYGYNRIPTEDKIHIRVQKPDDFQRTRQNVLASMIGSGFFETTNVGFVEDAHLLAFSPDTFKPVRVKDMTRKSNNALRNSLLPSLMEARRRNQDSGNGRCDLYELAAVHQPGNDGVPVENIMLGLISDGDFREIRGVIEAVIAGLDKQVKFQCRPADLFWAAPGTGGELLLAGQIIGYAGLANENVLNVFDLNSQVTLAQIDFNELVKLQGHVAQMKEIIRFPSITRDLSVVLDESVAWGDIEQAIWQCNAHTGDDLQDVRFVEIYRGKGVPNDKKSLMLSMEFRRVQETLTHEQVDEYQKEIIDMLAKSFHAHLRA